MGQRTGTGLIGRFGQLPLLYKNFSESSKLSSIRAPSMPIITIQNHTGHFTTALCTTWASYMCCAWLYC